MSTLPLRQKLVEIAKAEVGVSEVNGSNKGPRVDEFKSATNLPPHEAWPWCAAFVCWCFREAMKGGRYTFTRPTTAGAWDLENWSLAQDASTQTKRNPGRDIQAGDVITYRFSHCGIAVGAPDKNGNVRVCEGNTDGAGRREGGSVLIKTRHISKIRARIRVTV